jgi:hypothetical protein
MKTFLFSFCLIILSVIFNASAQSYYPLEIGNEWVFYDSTYYYGGYDVDTTIIKVIDDSTFSNGKTYFVLSEPDFVDARYVRTDSLGIYYYDTGYQEETLFYRFDLPIDTPYNVHLGVYFFAKRIAEGQWSLFNVPYTWQEFYLDGLAVCFTVLSDKFGPVACQNLYDPPEFYITESYLIGAVISDTVYGFVPVPVELISFTASLNSYNQVVLNWKTSTETNNRGFEIQRRCNDQEFFTIGFVKGNGTTTEWHNYTYIDKNLNLGKYFYRLKQFDFDGSFHYSDVANVDFNIPLKYALEQNYPNPFNPTTKIKFSIPKEVQVNLNIYNILGEKVKELKNEVMKPGNYEVNFKASSLASGVYFYRIKAGDFVQTKKMIFLK